LLCSILLLSSQDVQTSTLEKVSNHQTELNLFPHVVVDKSPSQVGAPQQCREHNSTNRNIDSSRRSIRGTRPPAVHTSSEDNIVERSVCNDNLHLLADRDTISLVESSILVDLERLLDTGRGGGKGGNDAEDVEVLRQSRIMLVVCGREEWEAKRV